MIFNLTNLLIVESTVAASVSVALFAPRLSHVCLGTSYNYCIVYVSVLRRYVANLKVKLSLADVK